jgi:hypothetical protein
MPSRLINGRVYSGSVEALDRLQAEEEQNTANKRTIAALVSSRGSQLDLLLDEPSEAELASLRRLVDVAKTRSGQGGRCADFLLSWWNAGENGGFDMVHLWGMDTALRLDMCRVFCMVARLHAYPDGNPRLPDLRSDLEAIMDIWRAPKRKRSPRRKAAK